MNFYHKGEELRKIIKDTLSPYINQKCCLIGLPYYHTNAGDFLIWQGVELFLKELGIPCVYRASCMTYRKSKIPENAMILLNGGGDFGDTWEEVQEFRRQIVNEFPHNKIIVLPQTVFYADQQKVMRDAEQFSHHKSLILCARDTNSYNILKQYFYANTVLLVPDMAFFIYFSNQSLQTRKTKETHKVLFLKRNDKEFNKTIDYSGIPKENLEVKDWSTIDNKMFSFFILRVLFWLNRRIPVFSTVIDMYALYFYKKIIIKSGIQFLNNYHKIFTTRLHGAILCCLLSKPFVLFNNSYGKNKNFYETWLQDLDNTAFYS
jgi:pyruvyl transferase EpsO